MINSEKLSLFCDGNSNSVGLTDIPINVSSNQNQKPPTFSLSLNKEVISKLTSDYDWNEKDMVASKFTWGIFGAKHCTRRKRRRSQYATATDNEPYTDNEWHCNP